MIVHREKIKEADFVGINPKRILLLIILLSGVLISLCIREGHLWGDDFALYIAQAKALLNSTLPDLYAWNRFSMQNSMVEIGPYLYPNGFPFLLSPVYYCFGMNFIAMKVFCALFLLLSIPLAYRLFKNYFSSPLYVYCILISFAFHAEFITFSDNVLSDLPFFAISLMSFLMMVQKNTLINQILLGFLIFFSYFIRDVGLLLIPSLMAYHLQLLFKRQQAKPNWHFYFLPYLVFILLYVILILPFPHGSANHYNILENALSLSNIKENLSYYSQVLAQLAFAQGAQPILLLPLLLLIVLGMLQGRGENLHFIVYVLLLSTLTILWPAKQGARLFFPIVPLLVFFTIKGALFLWQKFKWNKVYLQGLLLVSVTTFILIQVFAIVRYAKTDNNEVYSSEMREMYRYIRDNIPSNAIVAFEKPRALNLFTGRHSIFIDPYRFSKSLANYLLIRKAIGADYLGNYHTLSESETFALLEKNQRP